MATLQFPHFEIFKGNSSMDTLTQRNYGGGRVGGGQEEQDSGSEKKSLNYLYRGHSFSRSGSFSSLRGRSRTDSPRVSAHIALTVEEAQTALGELMDNIEEKLQEGCGWEVGELVEKDSLGDRTCTSIARFNPSIVIYSKDISASEMEQKSYESKLSQLNMFIQSDDILALDYQHVITLPHCLQCTYAGVHIELSLSPLWRKPGDFYNFLESVRPQKRVRYSVCASKWQVQFLKQQLNQAKDFKGEYIKKAKAWRDKLWSRGVAKRGRPSSYLLSLLVVRAYDIAKKKLGVFSSMTPATLAWQTMEELKSIVQYHNTMDIYWEQYYSLQQYPTLVPPNSPRFLDPANPSNNLYVTGMGDSGAGGLVEVGSTELKAKDWDVFRRSIHTLDLSKPLHHWL